MSDLVHPIHPTVAVVAKANGPLGPPSDSAAENATPDHVSRRKLPAFMGVYGRMKSCGGGPAAANRLAALRINIQAVRKPSGGQAAGKLSKAWLDGPHHQSLWCPGQFHAAQKSGHRERDFTGSGTSSDLADSRDSRVHGSTGRSTKAFGLRAGFTRPKKRLPGA